MDAAHPKYADGLWVRAAFVAGHVVRKDPVRLHVHDLTVEHAAPA